MNYIGSKSRMTGFLLGAMRDVVGEDWSEKVFCDLFAGTAAVGNAVKPLARKVIANDLETYSFVLNRNYIGNCNPLSDWKFWLSELNNLPPISDGFIYRNYCLGSGSGRCYFSDANGMKIDAMRQAIGEWLAAGSINQDMYYFLLCSLLEEADRLANTASVYGAFLKTLKPMAMKPLVLTPANFDCTDQQNEVYQEDANTLIRRIEGDILYLDPPYNVRQYGANYHILNTIANYNAFVPKGKTGLPPYKRSRYCSRVKVLDAFEDLLKNARFRYVFLSYNNEGLLSPETIRQTMSKYGRYDCIEMRNQRFKADSNTNRVHHARNTTEYLFVMEVR